MNRNSFFSQFTELPFFTKKSLIIAAEQFEIPKNSLNTHIRRGLEKKEIVNLKRGLYVNYDFFIKNRPKLDYIFCVASKLLEPSYVSRETALQYYGLLSEASRTVFTCITLRTTRKVNNSLGIFDYKSTKSNFFMEYTNICKEFNFYIAEPYKAIFDYLYFRIPINELRNKEKVLHYLDEFRIDYERLENAELDKLFAFISEI